MTDALNEVLAVMPRRFKPYPAYKDSGVEWLGEMPAHWEVKRLKNCVLRLESGGTPESDNFAYWSDDESGIPWVAISDMTRSFHVRDTAKRLTERGHRSKRLPVLPTGTLLYSMYASLGKVAVLEINAVVNQAILGLVARDELVSRDYLRWWLEFMQGHVQLLSSSNTQDNLNADKVRKMPVFVPGLDAQRSIVACLDRETTKIDALVAKKDRLIALLKEKRTALISRAVTKGLDPTVPMNDSGVEWLGEIPAHWESGALRRFWSVIDCKHRTAVYVDDGLPIVSTTEVKPGRLVLDGPRKVAPEDFTDLTEGGRRPRPGDIVYSRNASIGAAAYVETDEPFCMGQDVCLITSERDQLYLAYQLNSPVALGQIEAVSVGSTFERINVAQIKTFDVACPPTTEQSTIAAFLDLETARIDALVAKVRAAIDRLKELRTALISAAVTGKIDVRGEVA